MAISSNAMAGVILLEDVDAVRIQDGDENGTGDSVQRNQLWAGNIAGDDWGLVYVFRMTGASSGSGIVDADFSITQDNGFGAPVLLADVFTRSSATVNASDYENASVTNLMSGFGSTYAGSSTLETLDLGGQGVLTTFLQTNWVENDHVFIRLRSATFGPAPLGNAYRFGVSTGYTAASVDALLTVTTAIPEPSSFAVLGIGFVALMSRRKRKRVCLNKSIV